MKPNRICKGTTNSKASIQKEGKMKRILVIALLAGVLISTIGVTMAVGQGNPTITRPIFACPFEGGLIGRAVGIITLNTETGEWTLTTEGPLHYTDADLYTLGITLSAPLVSLHGRWAIDYFSWGDTVYSVDGRIEASGTVTPDIVSAIQLCLEDGAVFILLANSV